MVGTKMKFLAAVTIAGAACACVALVPATARAAVIDLQNDGFVDMASVGFQQGFVAGEFGGSTLGKVNDPFVVNKITLLFGPGNNPQTTVTLHIYEDDGMGNVGAEIYTADVQIMPADNALQVIDLTGQNVMAAAGSIRVAFEFHSSGPPSIARDGDGTISPGKNWVFTGGVWKDSVDLGLTGDWIIRAEVETMTTTTSSSAASGSGAGTGSGSASTGSGTSSTSSGTSSGGGPCTPGAVESCTGESACAGVATCNADGTGFGACDCSGFADDGCGCVVPGESRDAGSPWSGLAGGALMIAGAAGLTWKRARERRKRA